MNALVKLRSVRQMTGLDHGNGTTSSTTTTMTSILKAGATQALRFSSIHRLSIVPIQGKIRHFPTTRVSAISQQLITMATAAPQDTPPSQSWWEAFPEAQSSCPRIEAAEVKELIEKVEAAGKGATRDFLLVDVRRTDWEGGTVATSINLPAHTFYQTRPVTYQLCKQAGIKKIIFYCGKIQSHELRLLITHSLSTRKLRKQRSPLRRLDARLPQRSRRNRDQSADPQRRHQRLAKGVRR